MRKHRSILTWILLLAIWAAAAVSTDNEILIPYPSATFQKICELLVSKTFYLSLAATVLRVLKGFLLSFACAFVFAVLSDTNKLFRDLLSPVQTLTKTIPNISYMIIAILWLGAEGAVSAVSFMVIFPIFLNGFLNELDSEPQNLKDVEMLYPETFFCQIRYKLIGMLKMTILQECRTAVSMGFKIGIMAEILGSVRSGIGRQMAFARSNLDMTSIFAWTIIVVILSVLADGLFNLAIRYIERREGIIHN